MTKREALQILQLNSNASMDDVKKRYRKLLHLVHPDAMNEKDVYPYEIFEIQEAYEYLRASGTELRNSWKNPAEKKDQKKWSAPENLDAPFEREIFTYMDDEDGNHIGTISIAKGKYYWTMEEDYNLFLNSIMSLFPGDEIHPEEFYQLAVKYIDGISILNELYLSTETPSGILFTLEAMLELSEDYKNKLKPEDSLYPFQFKKHRLYLMDEKGTPCGYLSFKDDRLYYILIPLFEEKKAQVKLTVSKNQTKKVRRRKDYVNLTLKLRLCN